VKFRLLLLGVTGHGRWREVMSLYRVWPQSGKGSKYCLSSEQQPS